jgi:hypothetical protein
VADVTAALDMPGCAVPTVDPYGLASMGNSRRALRPDRDAQNSRFVDGERTLLDEMPVPNQFSLIDALLDRRRKENNVTVQKEGRPTSAKDPMTKNEDKPLEAMPRPGLPTNKDNITVRKKRPLTPDKGAGTNNKVRVVEAPHTPASNNDTDDGYVSLYPIYLGRRAYPAFLRKRY